MSVWSAPLCASFTYRVHDACTLVLLLPSLPGSLMVSFLDYLEQWRLEMIRTAEEMVEEKVK